MPNLFVQYLFKFLHFLIFSWFFWGGVTCDVPLTDTSAQEKDIVLKRLKQICSSGNVRKQHPFSLCEVCLIIISKPGCLMIIDIFKDSVLLMNNKYNGEENWYNQPRPNRLFQSVWCAKKQHLRNLKTKLVIWWYATMSRGNCTATQEVAPGLCCIRHMRAIIKVWLVAVRDTGRGSISL